MHDGSQKEVLLVLSLYLLFSRVSFFVSVCRARWRHFWKLPMYLFFQKISASSLTHTTTMTQRCLIFMSVDYTYTSIYRVLVRTVVYR
jgi:hypothetical protein